MDGEGSQPPHRFFKKEGDRVKSREKVEAQSKTLVQMEKTCRKLRPRVDSLIEKANQLGKKYDKKEGDGETYQPLITHGLE